MKTETPRTRRLPVTHHPWGPGGGDMPEMLDTNNNNNNTNNINRTMSYSYNINNNTRNTTITNINNTTNSTSSSSNNNSSNSSSSNSSNRAAAAAGQNGESRNMKLPTIGERRSSVTRDRRMSVTGTTLRKPRASSLNDTLTEMSTTQRRGSLSTEGPAVPTQRRASVPQGTAPVQPSPNPARRGSKLTFQGAGRRVSMLVKYRQAFQSRNKTALQEDEEDENPMEAIREMPHSPRFSTFMSAEAQYAMMKGYEDKLYEKISGSNPEARTSLQRSKTPYQKKISIVDQDKRLREQKKEEEGEEGERVGGSRDSPEVQSTSSVTSSSHSSSGSSLPARTRTLSVSAPFSDVLKPLDSRASTISSPSPGPVTISVPYLKPLRRQSLASTSPTGKGLNPMSSMESSLETLHLQRCHSLPTLDPPGDLSLNKRLVLTYRLESAMDLLDSLKPQDSSQLSLSPRVSRGQKRGQGDVVRNFNCWAQVWNKEFQEIHTK